MHRKLILTAAAVAALGVSAPAAQAAFPGQNGPILFGTYAEDGSGIFTTSPSTSPSQLFATERTPDGLDISADGTRLAYNESDFSIWVSAADGSGKKRLTPEGVEDFAPSWSPDGKKIAFASREIESCDWTLWTMNADGTGRQELGSEEDPVYGFQPAWSPDGKKIAFTEYSCRLVRGDRGDHSIAVTDPAGSDVDYLTSGNDAEWTPDGKSLVYVDTYYSYGELERYDLASGEDVQLTDGEDDTRYSGPAVSPDGKRIVAQTETYRSTPVRGSGDYFYELGTLNVDGSGTTVLSGTGNGGGAEWSPIAVKPAPVRENQQTPAPAPQQQPVTRSVAPSKARVCGSRRYFRITVLNKGLKKVAITVNGTTVSATRKGRGFSARVDLRRLPKGRFTVKIRKTFAGGAVKHETRRYRTCVPKARG